MITILHGYLLEGSGSNLWTRSIIQSLCNNGETVHLMCQENHPQIYDFISEAILYLRDGSREIMLKRDTTYPGKCIMHKPQLGETLPVYVPDKYEEFSDVQPMVNLDDDQIEAYLRINTAALKKIVKKYQIEVLHANHAVLMSVVARRVAAELHLPYAIMPHGSAIEYAVKKDKRFYRFAEEAFDEARRIYVIGKEIRQRVAHLFPALPDIESKMVGLNLGVNTSLFKPLKKENRNKHITQINPLLKGYPRGKTAVQTNSLRASMTADIAKEKLLKASADAARYNAKLPDANVEEKLQSVDWKNEKIILFVGRLIANKGLHSIIGALPRILASEPDTRLIVVGHGPQREPLEALIWAMEQGHADLAVRIAEWGRGLEGSGNQPLDELLCYFDELRKENALDAYFEDARNYLSGDRVLFTGYLRHRELCYLFPACDVAIFPSVVAEAGPLVFLEAMASGCFPIGTYFAGMAASIDSVAEALPPEITELMKISHRPQHTIADLITRVKPALHVDDIYRKKLRAVAIKKYDWNNISKKLAADLHQLK